ncbi:DNA polymerase V [Pantoea brenneri]|uniref:DNA polymerase V n=1 Tax=Pantoea brenneri TaxID=472694 RepID=UPI0028A10812|nr:DNA polymerase V [Pantoea brenneri]
MARTDDILFAFTQSIKMEESGRRTITTRDFVAALERYNWRMSLREANQWIENYTHNFRDISTEEGEARTFQMFNPNGGI